MERWVKRAIELGAGLFLTGKSNPSVIPYYPQKTRVSGEEKQYFRRTSPEKVGITSGRILAMLIALEKEKRANVHNLLVLKDGEVICQCSHPGYDVNIWHLSHSMSKTVTGMAIGMLTDDGILDINSPVADFFPEYHYRDKRFAAITVKHLLNMTSGIKFSEAGTITESKWTEAFFDSSMAFAPGEGFNYNSMNSYVLARIVTKLTGRTLTDFLTERLFGPLGITNFFWEVGPEGVEKGGWGLFLSVESWAKLGIMMLGGGVFEGKRILSEEWVKASTTDVIVTPGSLGHYNYGYQIWVSDAEDGFLFNGMLGQNVWVCPKNNIVVALNSGNNELFQNSPAMEIIERYLGQDLSDDLSSSCFAGDITELTKKQAGFFESRHWVRPYAPPRGISYRLGLRHKERFPTEWNEMLGRYHFRKNQLSILPLFVRAMQNNLHSSIDGVAFEREGNSLYFSFTEGGKPYKLEVGFSDFKESVLEVRGEKYMVKVIGEAMEDEDRNMLFKLEFLFPEMPNTRMLKFSFLEEGRLLMRMSEIPNQRIADVYIKEINSLNSKMKFLQDVVDKKVGHHYVERKLSEAFAPSLIGARIGAENYTAIMDEEREKLKAGEKTSGLITAIIERFIRDDEDHAQTEEGKSGLRTFFDDIVDRFRSKVPKGQKNALPETAAEALPTSDVNALPPGGEGEGEGE